MVRERRPLHGVRRRAVRVQLVDPQPAHLARESAPARSRLRRRARELVRRAIASPPEAGASDVHAVHPAWRDLEESRRRLADGTVLVCRRHAGRLLPRAPRQPRARHRSAWKRIVGYVHDRTSAKIALQLGHAGPKGSTQLGWEEADEPLAQGNWPLIAPSAIAYGPRNQLPRAMTRADMGRVTAEFVRAARWGAECGF